MIQTLTYVIIGEGEEESLVELLGVEKRFVRIRIEEKIKKDSVKRNE